MLKSLLKLVYINPIRFLLLLVFSGCAGVSNLNTADIYKREMGVRINGNYYKGTASVGQRTRYHLDIYMPEKPDLLKLATCHRELTVQKPGKHYKYEYIPVPREQEPPCFMELVALDKSGENLWGLIDFVSPDETMVATVGCNGKTITAVVGSAVCQARVGLVQTISFAEEVETAAPSRCPELKDRGDYYEYVMDKETCQYLFANEQGKLFRLMTAGYTEVLIYD